MSIESALAGQLDKHVKSRPAKATGKKVRRVEIEPAEGGYMATTHFEHGEKGEYSEPHKSVHKTLASVHAHMKGCM